MANETTSSTISELYTEIVAVNSVIDTSAICFGSCVYTYVINPEVAAAIKPHDNTLQ